MRAVFLLPAAAALAALAGSAVVAAPARKAAAPARKAAPAARDWSRTVAATPEGGFRMGNPAARVKLVEYGSLTCGHCAAFAREGTASLVGAYVKSGKVSYEYRNFILNGLDVAASLVARCAPPSRFFPFVDRLYATQPAWMERNRALSQAEKDRLRALPEDRRLGALADRIGLTAMAAQFGVPAAKARTCLTDKAGLDRLDRLVQGGEALGVQGTPTFLLNGANIGSHTWATLEPILREAAGS